MPRFLIVIGNRELEIDAPDLITAQQEAMNAYPGETVSGFAQLTTDDEPTDDNDTEDVENAE